MSTKSLSVEGHAGLPAEAPFADPHAVKETLVTLLRLALSLVPDLLYPDRPARKAKVVSSTRHTLDELATLLADTEHPAADLLRAQLTTALVQVTAYSIAERQRAAAVPKLAPPSAEAARRPATGDANAEISTEEAAALLFVSRPYVVKLLDSGQLPLAQKTVGGQRRVRMADVLKYKAAMKTQQARALEELTAASEALNLDAAPPYKHPKRKAR